MYPYLLPLLLLLAFHAPAQSLPSSAVAPAVATSPLTATDTVRALHRLFQQRRTRAAIVGGVSGAAAVGSFVALQQDPGLASGGTAENAVVGTAVAGLYTLPIWTFGISQAVRFSRKKEQLIVSTYEVTHQLPARIRRRLQPRYFVGRD